MKVVCIKKTYQDRDGYYYLTIGKKYNVNGIFQMLYKKTIFMSKKDYKYYYVIDDTDTLIICPSSCFITLEELRNKKLEDIGI